MWSYLKETWDLARLKLRYRKLLQERLLSLVEQGPQPVAEDPGQWSLTGQGKNLEESARTDLRTRARELVTKNAHARNILRLLEVYVVGPGLRLTHTSRGTDAAGTETRQRADRWWREFLEINQGHFSYREFGRRAWRDGECFVRFFPRISGPPAVRFIDPEAIGPTADFPESQGIVTAPDDVEQPTAYLRIDPASCSLVEEIAPAEMLHVKLGVDSNQKRGMTIFAPVLETLDQFEKWLDGELLARRLQSSIVLWRRVQGSPSQIAGFADAAQGDAGTDPLSGTRRERIRGGTILTTSQGTDLQFLQPNTNFGDAVPLGRMLLLSIAAGQGLPEFMVTSDASNGSYASTMVAEGPAVKMFQAEQQACVEELRRLWRTVMQEGITQGCLPWDFFERIEPHWNTPELVNRDRPRERLADARLVDSQILSRAEVARRDGVDPRLMHAEISAEGGQERPGAVPAD